MTTLRLTDETRKIQFTGGSTFVISLPKRWIEHNQLNKGTTIRLREEESGLLSIIPAEKVSQGNRNEAIIRVKVEDKPEELIRKTISTYLFGYSLIHFEAENTRGLTSTQRFAIKDFSRNMLVGTEIVKDTPEEVTLQVLLRFSDLSIQSALRRMSIIAVSMHREALIAFKTLDYALAREVISTDNEVDRFNLYVERQLRTAVEYPRIIKEIGLQSTRDCLGYRLVAKALEISADQATYISEQVLLLKNPLKVEIIQKIEQMSNVVLSMLETAIEALLKEDYIIAESLIENLDILSNSEREAISHLQEIDSEEIGGLRLIIESLRRTSDNANDIAENVRNLTIESVILSR